MIEKRIDSELLKAISTSEWNKIPYARLLQEDPQTIREQELKLSALETPLDIPSNLEVGNFAIPSHEEGRNISLRTYKPKGKTNLPIYLYFHGGAFIFGSPEQYDFIFYRLAIDIEALIISVDYRLAPEYPFPAAIEDGYDSLVWISSYAEEIGGNPQKIICGGSSAGGTIALSINHLARDLGIPKIAHQYLLYPPTDYRLISNSMKQLANAPMQSRDSAYWMWKHYLQNETNVLPKYAVPYLEDDFKGLPSTTIVVCELDPLRDEGINYAKKLKEAEVDVDLHEIKGAVHTFDFFECSLSTEFYVQQVEMFKQIINKK